MKNILLLITKFFLIVLLLVITLFLMAFLGLKFVFFLLFSTIAKNIWSYRPIIYKVKEEEVYDYYSIFGVQKSFENTELAYSYANEIDKINNNPNISIESRKELLELFKDAFEVLNNPISKSKYDLDFENYKNNLKIVEQKNKENKFNFIKDTKKMLSFEKEKMNKMKIALIIGLIIAFIIDIIMLANH
jgi:hypothetical protein